MRRLLMIASALAVVGCSDGREPQARSSITVKLPPARAYAPKPAFSFGSAPRDTSQSAVKG